jgi:hypothetical protein
MRSFFAKVFVPLLVALLVGAGCMGTQQQQQQRATESRPSGGEDAAMEGWILLFDGESLSGWKAGEHPESFSVNDGRIVVDGPRAHLFYVGPARGHDFENFVFEADVRTTPGSNSGIYFHTRYQEAGWPAAGYEAQINNTYASDPIRTASLYAIEDIEDTPVEDGEWFTMYIRVEGDHIVIKADGETMVDYTEPENPERPRDMAGRVLSSGTFALQAYDPESKVYFKDLKVRPLP